jgi:hypothetical protein
MIRVIGETFELSFGPIHENYGYGGVMHPHHHPTKSGEAALTSHVQV